MKSYFKFILIFILGIVLFNTTVASANQSSDKAEILKSLGLLKGTNQGFDLDKVFTRAQGTVVVTRLLGKESILSILDSDSHFQDVDKNHWAAKHISFAYKNGIVHGTSAKNFSPESQMSGRQFLALVLRGIGYQEASPETASVLAVESGMLLQEEVNNLISKKVFLRLDMVNVMYNALTTKIKGQKISLLQQLVSNKAISKDTAIASGLYGEPEGEQKTGDPMDRIENAIKEALN